MRPRPSLVPFVALIVALAFLATCAPGCGPKTKPVLVKFDASALTAVQTIAEVEKDLSRLGQLTPAQALDIRLKLRPVIDLGEKATAALLAWQPGDATPAAMLTLSGAIGDLVSSVTALLPDGSAKAKILAAVALAQQAWAAAIVVMSAGKAPAPNLMPALVGAVGGGW